MTVPYKELFQLAVFIHPQLRGHFTQNVSWVIVQVEHWTDDPNYQGQNSAVSFDAFLLFPLNSQKNKMLLIRGVSSVKVADILNAKVYSQ